MADATKEKAKGDTLIEMKLTGLTQKSAGKAIIDHPTTVDRDLTEIRRNPCSATRNSSTPGEPVSSPLPLCDDYAPISRWGIFTLAKRLKWWSTKLGR